MRTSDPPDPPSPPAPGPARGELSAPPGASVVVDRVLVGLCVVVIGLSLLEILTFGYGRDQGIYAMVGRAILAGKMPYRDAWDFKPPGVFIVYAFARALLGSAQSGIRVVEVFSLLGMTAAMMRIADEWWGERRIGLYAGAIAVLVHAQLDFWHTAQPESFGGCVTMAALAVLGPAMGTTSDLHVEDRAMTRRFLLCGALFGFAGLLKPPLAGGGAIVAAAIGVRILSERTITGRARHVIAAAVRPGLLILAGGATPFVLCLLWFAAKGALHDLHEVLFVFTPHYTKLSWVDRTVLGMGYEGFTEWLCNYSSVTTVTALVGLAFPRTPRERFGVRIIGGIIAVHIVGVIMQAKFFPYHWGATWPLTAMLGGLGVQRVWERLGRLGFGGLALLVAGGVLVASFRTASTDLEKSFWERSLERARIFTHAPRDMVAVDKLASVADVNAVANREVAAFVAAHVPPGGDVFVWGFEPVIYDLADRSPSTRYIYDVPQRVAWARDKERATLMSDLAADPPKAIVVERRDVFPMVTGDAIDSADTLQTFPELRAVLAKHYTRATTIEDFDIYLAHEGG